MGIFNFISPSFGLPFVTGSLPHSPQLVRALTDVAPADSAARGAEGTDDGGESLSAGFLVADAKSSSSAQKKKKSVLEFRVFENRLAPFLMYLLIGMPVFVPKVMTYVPDGAVDGVLTFVGVAGIISDNQLWERIVCLLTVPANFPSVVRPLRKKWWKVHLYTIIQLTLLALAWGVNLSPAGLLFSVIIVAIVPFNKVSAEGSFVLFHSFTVTRRALPPLGRGVSVASPSSSSRSASVQSHARCTSPPPAQGKDHTNCCHVTDAHAAFSSSRDHVVNETKHPLNTPNSSSCR